MADQGLEEDAGDEEAWTAALAAANARAQAEAQPATTDDEEERERARAQRKRERARQLLRSFESGPVERLAAVETEPVAPAPSETPALASETPALVEDSAPGELEGESAPFERARPAPPVEDSAADDEHEDAIESANENVIEARTDAVESASENLIESVNDDVNDNANVNANVNVIENLNDDVNANDDVIESADANAVDGGHSFADVEAEVYEPDPVEAVTDPHSRTVPAREADELVALLRAGRLILCAGPRLVEGRPTFVEVIGRVMQSLPFEDTGDVWPVLERNPLAAAGFARRKLGDRFGAALAEATRNPPATRAVQCLGALPFRAVVTTAYDDVLEQAFAQEGRPLRVYTPGDAAELLQDGKLPFVLKALGSAARVETVVFTSEELHATLASTEFRAATHELYRSRSFLFVGFERGDLDLAILLERMLGGAAAGELQHWAVLPGLGPVEKEELQRTWRIRVLDEGDVGALTAALEAGLAKKEAEGLPLPDDADAWLSILADDPRNADANANLDRVQASLREAGDYDRLADVVIGRAAVEPEAERRAQLLLGVARVFEHEAEDPARALTTLMAAYQQDPSLAAWHEVERLTQAANAWDELQSEFGEVLARLPSSVRVPLWRRLGRHAELVQALDERAAQPDGDDVRALRLEAAAIYADRLNDRVRAIARYEALQVEAPRDLAVLRALERLYDQDGRHEAYLEILEREAALTTAPTERAALLRRLARSWEDEAEGAARALQFWEKLLALDPDADDGLRAVEKLYRASERWPELIEILRRRAQRASGADQAALYCELGMLYETVLDEGEHALEVYCLADAAQPSEETAAALTRLYERNGQPREAIALLERRAKRAGSLREQIGLLCRAGELCGDLRDARGAEERFTRVLELDPTYAPAMTALAAIYRQNGEFLRAAKFLVEAVEHTVNRLERTRLHIAAAEMYERIDDSIKAVELYRAALDEDPEHQQAAERAADLLWGAQRHEELIPVLELLSRKESPDEATTVERLVRLAKSARAVGQTDKAEKAWARAAELDPTHLEAQEERAAYHLQHERWADALTALDKVFQHHIDRLPVQKHVELFSQMGRCELMLGAREGARELLARALEIDPTHRPSLLAQMELAQNDDPSALIEAKRALVSAAAPDEQARLLGEIGDLWATRLNDPRRAVVAWREALQRKPDDHRLLHKCLDWHVEEKAWPEALGVLDHLIDVERDGAVRARYHLTAGLICRDEVNRRDLAAGHLRAALDDDPTLDRATAALEQLLQSGQEWKELARFYRAQLKRISPELAEPDDGHNGERLRVWSLLGELCWEKLGDKESALAALEVALTFDAGNLDRYKRMADLYVQAGPRHFERSIAAHQRILAREKNRILSYRALKHLYIQTNQREKSVLCSAALMVLRKGEPDDARKVAAERQRPFPTARRVLGDDGWQRVLHPDEDRLLDALFALTGSTIAAGQAQPHKAHGLNRKEAIDLDDRHSYNKALRYVATTLDVPLPEAYERPEQREAVIFANCMDARALVPCVLLGAPLVGEGRSPVDQVFELARVLAHLRTERLLRLAVPHPLALAQVIEAAMALGAEGWSDPPATDGVGRTVLGMKRALPPHVAEQVAALGQKLRARGTRPDAAAVKWLHAADLTGLRAGWALAGDVEACARMVAADGNPPHTLPPTQRLLDLVWSSTTEELISVRRTLGLL